MTWCPFAIRSPVNYDGGAYASGPFRVVLHTIEGTAESAMGEFKARFAPQFVADEKRIWQLIDTDRAGAALEHRGPPETNRMSAIQIEMGGFAGKPKSAALLTNVRRLCRWIEATHGVPRVWPNGHAQPAINGQDPGHHVRSPEAWKLGGYFEHSDVPGNHHWDAGLTEDERKFLMMTDDAVITAVDGVRDAALSGIYTVVDGDTLFAITRKTGVLFESLAILNHLSAPYTIHPGDIIRLK